MEPIVNNLIKATGWSIFHSLWQAAIIYGILLAVAALFPRMTAKLKHNLAYGAMCLMFAGFSITFFSVFSWPVSEEHAPVTNASHGIIDGQYAAGLSEVISSQTEQLFPYIVSVYAIGLLFQLLILGAGYKKLQLLKQSEKSLVPLAWRQAFEEMLIKLNLRQQIGFYLSESVNIPMVIGYFKPVVFFPVALVAQLDIKQVEAILIHELSHIRRNDYLLNLIKTAIETLMFFNPFVWLSSRFINIEREHACDDLVLQLTETPLTYAHALLKLEILKDKTTPALSMAATGKQQHLYQRIKRITDMKTNYMNAKQQIFAIALTVATVMSLAWINPSKTKSSFVIKDGIMDRVVLKSAKQKNPFETKLKQLPVKHVKCSLTTDTTKKKRKFKIVTVDANGNKQEYNSVKEMPDSLRKEVIKDTFAENTDNFNFSYKFGMDIDSAISSNMHFNRSAKWQGNLKKMSEDMSKKFNSADWKKQQEMIQKQTAEIQKYFYTEDWKKQQKKIKEQALEMHKKFDSAEFRENLNAQIKDAQEKAQAVRIYISSPEFKKKLDEAKALENSSEYKELKKKFEAEVEALKKKKMVQPDNAPF
jgi:bla regulator protein BlaR1